MAEKAFRAFNQKINELIKLGRPKIAFGLKDPSKEILDSLKRGQKYADIILVGPEDVKKIQGFELIVENSPEEKIAAMLAKNEVDGIIRGTIDDFKAYEAYQKMTGERCTATPALLQDPFGRQFFISPASNPEGWEKEQRLLFASGVAEFLKQWNIEPKIAIFTGERHETYPRKRHIRDGVVGILNKTYEDAEWIVSELKKGEYEAKNWAIDLNPAVEAGYNIIVPVNGMIGNQIFRVLLFCGGKLLACPRIGLSRCYEETSRTEKDFEFHIKWLTAWINSRRK